MLVFLSFYTTKLIAILYLSFQLTASNATQVTLRNVGFRLSGNFSCEVTADAPSFHTSVASNALTVVGKSNFLFIFYFVIKNHN